MSARTEELLQHGSVEGMIEAVLDRVGAGQLKATPWPGDEDPGDLFDLDGGDDE